MDKLSPAQQLSAMIALAAEGHRNQFDKGGHPYIRHTLAVMYLLGSDDDELYCIAVGHDLFEDTDFTKDDLLNIGISERVVKGILALTKQNGESYDEYKQKVFDNHDAVMVKMADLTHNSDIRRLKGVTEKDLARIVKYAKFYDELKEVHNAYFVKENQ
jgi:(p)ppGpp synthase/HD superfamily hydrolase